MKPSIQIIQDQMRDKENKLKLLADIFHSNGHSEAQASQGLPSEERSGTRTVSELQSLYHTPSRAATTSAARVSLGLRSI